MRFVASSLDRIFPIKDEASARLAVVKADCLRAAHMISEGERTIVLAVAAAVIDPHKSR